MNSSSGNEVDDELAVRAQRFLQGASPPFHFRFALDQDLTDQSLEGLCQGRVRDVALVLVELAGREEAARRNEHLVQLIHHRGFADTGITRDQHKFRRAVGHTRSKAASSTSISRSRPYSFSGISNRSDASCAPSGNGSMRPCDCHCSRHRRRSASRPDGGLVALLGVLGEQLHDDGRQRLGDCGVIAEWCRLARNVAVDPLQGVAGSKRQRAGKHLVQGDAKRV